MSVVALKGVVRTSRKQAWMDQVAQAYDKFQAHSGAPEALILIQIGKGKVRSTWDIQGRFKKTDLCSTALLISAEHLRRQSMIDDIES